MKSIYPILLALLSAALFGVSTPLSKPLLVHFSSFQLAGLLYIGASIAVLPAVFRGKAWRSPWQLQKKNIYRLAGAIGFGGILGPLLLLYGLRLASAASVSMWLNMELVATAILGFAIFKDHLGFYGWLGVIGALFAGILLTFSEGIAGIQAGVLVTMACLCWALDNHLTALIDGIGPAESTFWKGLFAGGINLIIGFSLQAVEATVVDFLLALLIGSFSYGLSIVLYITAAQNMGAIRSQLIFASAPFFGVFISAVYLGEPMSILQWVALGSIAIAIALIFRDRHSHYHEHEAMLHQHAHRHDDGHHLHAHPEQTVTTRHFHWHSHESLVHAHPHWPDLHHRHFHHKMEDLSHEAANHHHETANHDHETTDHHR